MHLIPLAVGVAMGFGARWWWDRRHKVAPGNLSYGPGMYGLDAGIPPEVAVSIDTAIMQERIPATLTDFANKTAALAQSRGTAWPLADHVLRQRAIELASTSSATAKVAGMNSRRPGMGQARNQSPEADRY